MPAITNADKDVQTLATFIYNPPEDLPINTAFMGVFFIPGSPQHPSHANPNHPIYRELCQRFAENTHQNEPDNTRQVDLESTCQTDTGMTRVLNSGNVTHYSQGSKFHLNPDAVEFFPKSSSRTPPPKYDELEPPPVAIFTKCGPEKPMTGSADGLKSLATREVFDVVKPKVDAALAAILAKSGAMRAGREEAVEEEMDEKKKKKIVCNCFCCFFNCCRK